MSWQHRDYAGADDAGGTYRPRGYYRGPGMRTISITTIIIIANAVIFFLTNNVSGGFGNTIANFAVMQPDAVLHGQVWRLFTATYLHANLGHLLANMIGLFFFGPALERTWGSRQYFLVYTLGGILGNVVFTVAGLIGFINPQVFGVGASGSVLALLGAAAVLFPNARIYLYFLFPISIRTFVLLYGLYFVWNVFQRGSNYGGDLCHLGGLALGLWWATTGGISLSGKHRTQIDPRSLLGRLFKSGNQPRTGPGAWEARMQQRREDEQTIDRILRKVHDQGMQSLTPAEKQALTAATQRRRQEEARLERVDRD